MEQVFSYIISLGAERDDAYHLHGHRSVYWHEIRKGLKSGLFVGVGFVGLGVVTAFADYQLQRPIEGYFRHLPPTVKRFDMGWPAAAAVATQYSSGSIDYPNLSGCQLPDVDYQDNTYSELSTSGTTGTSPLSVQWLTS